MLLDASAARPKMNGKHAQPITILNFDTQTKATSLTSDNSARKFELCTDNPRRYGARVFIGYLYGNKPCGEAVAKNIPGMDNKKRPKGK